MTFILIKPGIMRFLLSGALLLFGGLVVRFLYIGMMLRIRFRRMKAQGIPIAESHSLLFGHLLLLRQLNEGYPSDIHSDYTFKKLIQNWPKYFPNESKCPPLIYLDLWPFMPEPVICVVSPELCHQFTQEKPQPRHVMFKWALTPVTGGIDLISMDMADHRIWRAKLNPAFSSKNLFANVPDIVGEVEVFVRLLREMAGSGGDWGPMFPLYDRTCNLTFDVIITLVLGFRAQEQTNGPSPLLEAFRNLIGYSKTRNLKNMLERLLPSYRRKVARNSKVIRDILMPKILNDLNPSKVGHQKRVIDFAMQNVINGKEPFTSQFIDVLVSNIKVFLFAGHDTTAQTICWLLWEVNKIPELWPRLRAEHDEVLGPDPSQAGETLRQNPHKINELRYTAAVVKETLRLRGIGSTFRQASNQFSFVWEGRQYPAYDAVIQTAPSAMSLHPELWPRVNEFLPERYLVPEGHPLRPVENAWRPFEMGNMRCIGEGLAMIELTLVLVLTARVLDFDFNYSEWDRLMNRDTTKPPTEVDGERAYKCGEGLGCVKDELPTRVRMRSA
ncbi:sterigmatocystin biosynthesis P450 monooxygenase StcS [Annulohypoxylon maeteangense]|uniref:sterigmatocystin biosynthesis P450 monooxygenase StcS n=1 Tax=Annulohypoxylon maeteangense TaxID=1927788 RepID=UPI002008CF63|nr:sterigmatocystin biosynthesis P450 monooxygenase StcS [Annulohypoxylon maeteangense]KAI0890248.1 sterigmatocystin biosynthesis P450 monooxygenase StcS [Annulohypoxylon maeteangense]